jgi:hypothetical protein
MLTFRDSLSDAKLPMSVAPGQTIGLGLELRAAIDPCTCARVLVVGDIARRVLEDVHSAQVLAAVITDDHAAADQLLRSGLMVRPVIGVYATRAAAEAGVGRPLSLITTPAEVQHELPVWPQVVAVAPVRAPGRCPESEAATVRLALACVDYAQPLEVTRSVLERCQAILERWRDRMDQWSRHASRPIPPTSRAAAIAALDDDLNVARVVAMMSELEDIEGIEPGAKFEAFNYLDRVLAVDLTRDLGRKGR